MNRKYLIFLLLTLQSFIISVQANTEIPPPSPGGQDYGVFASFCCATCTQLAIQYSPEGPAYLLNPNTIAEVLQEATSGHMPIHVYNEGCPQCYRAAEQLPY